ncbi:MAG: 30S ribosomal protein S16 [Mycoplasmoidaceae bacterium]
MVKIRLTRFGRHKKPFYRLVAMDSRFSRDSSYIELLGTYEPFSGKIKLNKDIILKWLNSGAQPTETAKNMLKKEGIWKEFTLSKIKVKSDNSPKITKKPKIIKKEPVKKQKLSSKKSISNAELKIKIINKKVAEKKMKMATVSKKTKNIKKIPSKKK